MPLTPTEDDAVSIARRFFGAGSITAVRFPTGLSHYVFDVKVGAATYVVRFASDRVTSAFDTAVYWSKLLRPLGVPLPAIVEAGQYNEFAFQILERLSGTDLSNVYGALSSEQKRAIVADVVVAQGIVQQLPLGHGYGFVSTLEGPFQHATWRGVVEANLARSRGRLAATRLIAIEEISECSLWLDALDDYLAAVPPRPFLDDTTTKNVICNNGRLSGIVDVDEVCFGDPLFTPALTKAALVADGWTPDYVDFWIEKLGGVCEQQRRAVSLCYILFGPDQ